MKRKVAVFLIVCVATLLHGVATAQGLSIFAKQKVVIWEILDRNDRPLGDSFKRMIYQKIVDNCTNSDRYEVYNVNIEDIKRQINARGLQANFPNICKMIDQTADYIIFAEVEASQSAVGSQDVNIHVSMSLFRIKTASKVLSAHENAAADRQAVESAISRAMATLGISSTTQRQSAQSVTPTTIGTTRESAEELYKKGDELYAQKRYEEAIPYLKRAAEQGCSDAQFRLGYCCNYGKGVTKDYNEAVKWYRKAVEQGHVKAQYRLGGCYYYGRGVTEDYYEAVKWYRRAAEQGYAPAQLKLGDCYNSGRGVTQDYDEAIKWHRKAAEQGHRSGQLILGNRYYHGRGVTQDYYEAVKWYRKAAEQGSSGAQNQLGNCYYHGRGVIQDYYEAIKWYRKAAEKNNRVAEYNIGKCYRFGRGVPKDHAQAVRWYQSAAEKGYEGAKKALAEMKK